MDCLQGWEKTWSKTQWSTWYPILLSAHLCNYKDVCLSVSFSLTGWQLRLVFPPHTERLVLNS